MRVNVTKLLDKGLKRPTRAGPETGDLRMDVDAEGRKMLVLHDLNSKEIPIVDRLLHPQFADIGARAFTAHGYEVDRRSGQLFGQAWEIEPVRR